MQFGLRISSGGIDIEFQGEWEEDLPDYPGRFFFRGHPDVSTYINCCAMHVCALEVHRGEDHIQNPTNMDFEEEFGHVWATHQPDGGFQTSTIVDKRGKEREVVIYITPHGT